MVRDKLHCGELIKRLNDILGTCANKELKSDDMTASQIKMLIIICVIRSGQPHLSM